eukprot:Skav235871  [mRNA]  locus=scaffold1192:19337:20457:- [translate_table: standard]
MQLVVLQMNLLVTLQAWQDRGRLELLSREAEGLGRLFSDAKPASSVSKSTIRSAVKMASMANSRSPRTARKRSEENRKSNDGQMLQEASRSLTPPGRGAAQAIPQA